MNMLTLLRWGGPVLIGIAIGLYVMHAIDNGRIRSLRADLDVCTTERTACQDANDTNQNAIGKLKREITESATQCTARLRSKERKLAGVQRIDAMRSKTGGTHEKNDSRPDADPVLGALNSLYITAADSQNRVSRSPGTDAAGKPDVLPGAVANSRGRLYCLDFENALSLLKNQIIANEYLFELELIIEPLKEK